MTELVVHACGPMTSLQDHGRFGFQSSGVSPSGAMDGRALALANALVGNPAGEGAIEFMNLGGSLVCSGGEGRVALVGPAALSIDGRPVPGCTTALVREGETLRIGHARGGAFSYLAAAGGFAIPAQLGSLSLHLRSKLGGVEGRPLAPGDRLPVRGPAEGALLHHPGGLPAEAGPFRVMLGPQDDFISVDGLRAFLEEEFRVSPLADRMGYQLAGPVIGHAKGFNIVSDGIVTGHVQVPGSGQPIVLMRDRQTTGGYPKIATLISADLDRFAQLQPGATLRFRAVERDEAIAAARRLKEWLDALPSGLVPAGGALTTEQLMSLNLIGGMVDAHAQTP